VCLKRNPEPEELFHMLLFLFFLFYFFVALTIASEVEVLIALKKKQIVQKVLLFKSCIMCAKKTLKILFVLIMLQQSQGEKND